LKNGYLKAAPILPAGEPGGRRIIFVMAALARHGLQSVRNDHHLNVRHPR